MKSNSTKIEKGFNKIVDIMQFLSNMSLILIMTLISLDVLGRNLFNKPIKGSYELTELTAALLVFFALAVTHREGNHITIDFLVERFPEKVQKWLMSIIEICIAIVLFFMSYHILGNGLRLMGRNTTTTDLSLPLYPFLFIASFTLVIFAIAAIFRAINNIRQAVN